MRPLGVIVDAMGWLSQGDRTVLMRKKTRPGESASARFVNDVLNALTANIAVIDHRGVIIATNEAWRRFAKENGAPDDAAFLGVNYLDVCEASKGSDGGTTAMAVGEAIRTIQRGERSEFSMEYPCHFSGKHGWFNVRVSPLSQSIRPDIVIAHEDITERKVVENELLRTKQALEKLNLQLKSALDREQIAARRDELTGINNRRQFFAIARQEFFVAQRYRHPLALILFDIDHFKSVNDRWGHQVGDEILKHIAWVAGVHLRSADTLARYGGEEFTVLLPNSTATQASFLAERIRQEIAQEIIHTSKGPIGVTISAGIAEMSPDTDTLERLIGRADQAMYAAKRAGRNRAVTFFDERKSLGGSSPGTTYS